MQPLAYEEFEKVQLLVGTVVRAEPFPEARKPSIKMWIDLGELGVKQSSAQVTHHYTPESLVGTQVVCVVNLGVRSIAGFKSEVLTTGFADDTGAVVLTRPDQPVPNGSRLF
jgi:tRNA-binding protein